MTTTRPVVNAATGSAFTLDRDRTPPPFPPVLDGVQGCRSWALDGSTWVNRRRPDSDHSRAGAVTPH
jgi:hypothetical protein